MELMTSCPFQVDLLLFQWKQREQKPDSNPASDNDFSFILAITISFSECSTCHKTGIKALPNSYEHVKCIYTQRNTHIMYISSYICIYNHLSTKHWYTTSTNKSHSR